MVNLSLWIGVVLTTISLFGIIAIYSIIKNKNIENENIDKIIELGKWFFVSAAIPLSASVINDGFREREQVLKEIEFKKNNDMKEMEFFDKYTSIILKADGLIQRKLLCEYFVSVSPENSTLQKSWQKYEETVKQHIEDEKTLKNLKEKKNLTPEEKDRKETLEKTVPISNQSLMPINLQDAAIQSEKDGFQAIVDQKYQEAFDMFSKAEKYYPGLHNCFEIKNALNNLLKDGSVSENEKQEFLTNIVKKWSWGVPKDIFEMFKSQLQK